MPIDPIRRTSCHTLLAALWLAPAAAGAQSAAPPAPGSRVRVTVRDASPARTTGTLVALGGDTLRYAPDGDSTARVVLLSHVQELEVGQGRQRHTWQGFVTGAAIGALSGVVIGYASGDDPKQEFLSFSRGDKAAILGTAFGVIGGAVGTIIGFTNRSERWQRVQPPYAVTVSPGRGGMRLAMRIAL